MTPLHDDLEATLRASAAWRLLRTDHAPLILGFLGQVFVEENVRTIAGSHTIERGATFALLFAIGLVTSGICPNTGATGGRLG